MAREHLFHDSDMPADERASVLQGIERGPQVGMWLNTTQAAVYTGRTVKAFYAWRKRHGIVPASDGTVSRRDLDQVLATPRKPRVMAEASLANLRRKG